jgi:hypothetical protein
MAINEATQNLQQLSDPASYNEADLTLAFNEIEKSIQDISNALQGSAPGPPAPGPAPGPRRSFDNNTPIHLTNLDGTPFTMTAPQIIAALREKPVKDNFTGGPSKHAIALNAVHDARDEQQVVDALAGITLKNNKITGGKKHKTKKNRKQKGGFKYSKKAKRTPFSVLRSTVSNRKSSRSLRNTTTKR